MSPSKSHTFSVALNLVLIVLISMEHMSPKKTNGLPSFAHDLQILVVDHDTLSLMSTAATLKKYSFKECLVLPYFAKRLFTQFELATFGSQMSKFSFKKELSLFFTTWLITLSLVAPLVTTTALASVALSMIREQKDHYDLVMANIIMSSEVNINVAKKALAEGACFFLQKPISLDDLKNVWQHVYRKVRNPRKDTHKPNCAKKIDEAGNVLRPPTGGIRIHEVHTRSLRCKSGKVRRGEGNRQRELQCSRAEQQIATENHTKGAFGIKRPVDDKEEQEKAKKVKLNRKEWKIKIAMAAPKIEGAAPFGLRNFISNARPKSILKWMNVPNITLPQVASHLQKYRKQVQEIQEAGTTSLPSLSRPYSWNSRNEFPPARKTSLICRPYEQGTSTFGVQGNPAQLMTPNSFTRVSDYRSQNPYSEHRVMSHNTNHQSESLFDFYLRTHGKFQNLDEIIETNSFTLGAGMNEIEKRNHPLGLEETRFKNNFSAEVTGTTEVSMNQAELYTLAPTTSINSHNQNPFFSQKSREQLKLA
ncbi:unnamed protein product [Malus baccata var. baccata]